MKAFLQYQKPNNPNATLKITGSKSESNRLLILQALFSNLQIKNLSESDDTKYLQKGISENTDVVDIHHAGTAMRFLTGYFAATEGKLVLLTGSERMKERPIGVLVDALRDLGANIEYQKEVGFPPLKIVGQKLTKYSIEIPADVSSQYISALMLIAPTLDNGLTIHLKGKITSVPYINMTLSLLRRVGVKASFSEQTITISPCQEILDRSITVESDWSSASYFYSWMALSENAEIKLRHFRSDSLQGDSELVSIYESLGVSTIFDETDLSITLKKNTKELPSELKLDLSNTPDLAQTIAASCFGLGLSCVLTGLHTLKIKETDRLVALKLELEKLGAKVAVTNDTLSLSPSEEIDKNVTIKTYNDHRMAMAFAPLAQLIPLKIDDPKVVSKSYPEFWNDFRKLGLDINFQ